MSFVGGGGATRKPLVPITAAVRNVRTAPKHPWPRRRGRIFRRKFLLHFFVFIDIIQQLDFLAYNKAARLAFVFVRYRLLFRAKEFTHED